MSATSRSLHESGAYDRAEAAIQRRTGVGIQFATSRKAIGWYFETRLRMQAAHGMHPGTDLVDGRTGERARIVVDGGKGGDLDEVLATLSSLARALNEAHVYYPRGTAALVMMLDGNKKQSEIADEHKVTQQTISIEVGRAVAYLDGVLRAGGVLR